MSLEIAPRRMSRTLFLPATNPQTPAPSPPRLLHHGRRRASCADRLRSGFNGGSSSDCCCCCAEPPFLYRRAK